MSEKLSKDERLEAIVRAETEAEMAEIHEAEAVEAEAVEAEAVEAEAVEAEAVEAEAVEAEAVEAEAVEAEAVEAEAVEAEAVEAEAAKEVVEAEKPKEQKPRVPKPEEKRLSKREVYELMIGTAPSAIYHAARCKKLAEFILGCPESGELFAKQTKNAKDLLAAVSYHDFGKAFIQRECINEKYCRRLYEKKEYRLHTRKAEEYIRENSEMFEARKNTFDKYLFECSLYHHERFDGKGFPVGLSGDEIPFSARLCCVVDYIERTLDFDSGRGMSVTAALEGVERESGKLLDPVICSVVLVHREELTKVCDDLNTVFKRTPDARSKMVIRYSPMYSAGSYEFLGYDSVISLYDIDFGEVAFDLFRAVASKGDSHTKLDKIIRYKTLRQAELFARHGVDFKRLTLYETVRALSKKNYAKDLMTLIEDYEIEPRMIMVSVPEDFALDPTEAVIENLLKLREMGIRVSIYGFGELCTSFDVFEKFKFDEIQLSKAMLERLGSSKDAFYVATGMVAVARGLDIDVVCSEVSSVEDERFYASIGVNIFGGVLYGGALSPSAIENNARALANAVTETDGPESTE